MIDDVSLVLRYSGCVRVNHHQVTILFLLVVVTAVVLFDEVGVIVSHDVLALPVHSFLVNFFSLLSSGCVAIEVELGELVPLFCLFLEQLVSFFLFLYVLVALIVISVHLGVHFALLTCLSRLYVILVVLLVPHLLLLKLRKDGPASLNLFDHFLNLSHPFLLSLDASFTRALRNVSFLQGDASFLGDFLVVLDPAFALAELDRRREEHEHIHSRGNDQEGRT